MTTKRVAAAFSVALFAVAPAGAQRIDNPDLFGKSLEAAEQAMVFYGRYDHRDEMRRVAEIGYRVAQESGFEKMPMSFYLVDMPVPNAFALPGGQIFLTRGMLDLGLDDDMLAGLLGHEIGHVVREHGTRIQRRATLLNALSQVLLAGVMITAGNSGGQSPVPGPAYDRGASPGDRVVGAAATGLVVSELLLRSYSREFEDEADAEGQRMAAAAGYDPDGTRKLMALMRERLPESKQYGYWRTHPFFDQRVRAAAIREETLKVQEPSSADDYRRTTQQVLVTYRDENPPGSRRRGRRPEPEPAPERRSPTGLAPDQPSPPPPDLLALAALTAWPVGPTAEQLRLERLHRERDREISRRELYRDLGRLIDLYQEERDEVAALDPDSGLPDALDREIGAFRRQLESTYPEAVEVFRRGVFETEFLETFASNYPDAPESAEAALALGDAQARLGRPDRAVDHYLAAWREGPDSETGRRARLGLRNLAGILDSLAALQRLADFEEDAELAGLAAERLAARVGRFEKLENGSEFLKRYPGSPHAAAVEARLDTLAENLYGEVILYQEVGDHAKALDRIQKILTSAPLSRAAERLRAQAEVAS
ncbi:MAG: M48 family metalloprotease [Thermoanaerobaculia bacterium]|nr:M48 family metalloprotease [Thermoanaerobaculia bacterium]